MRIAIDHSPLVSTHKMAHKIRGTGFYTKHLISALEKFHPENEYILFTQGEKLNKNIDIFHFPYFDPFFLMLPIRKLGKTIITIHDLTPLVFPHLFPAGVKGRIKLEIQKYLAKHADAIITDSVSSKLDIERLFHISPEKIFPVLLAAGEQFKKIKIDEKEKSNILKKYDIPEEFILYVGDATPNKNLPTLIDAVEGQDIHLVLAGGALSSQNIDSSHPWNRDLVYVQKKVSENKNMHILGFVPDEDLVMLYNLAEVFVFPSMYEGFGLPVLEAARCGTPVITTRGGSIPEVIGEAALFFDPEDEMDLRKQILLMLHDKKLRTEYSKKSLVQAEKFSWKKTADETVNVYESVF